MALQIFCFCAIQCPSCARSERGIRKVYRAPPEHWGRGECPPDRPPPPWISTSLARGRARSVATVTCESRSRPPKRRLCPLPIRRQAFDRRAAARRPSPPADRPTAAHRQPAGACAHCPRLPCGPSYSPPHPRPKHWSRSAAGGGRYHHGAGVGCPESIVGIVGNGEGGARLHPRCAHFEAKPSHRFPRALRGSPIAALLSPSPLP